jgi:WD40 repeat protein
LKELFSVAFPRELLCAALSIDGKHLVAGGSVGNEETRKQLLVWDWRNSTQPGILGRHDSMILDIQFSPDGRHLASASEDGMVRVWDATRLAEAQSGRTLWPKSAVREMPRIAFSPDSKRLASGDGFNDVVVLDVETGALALPRLLGHGDMVICVAFSPNGKFLASAGADNTVRLWDASSGKLLRTYFGHTSVINSVAFSPDSRILASGGQDQVIKLWRVNSD